MLLAFKSALYITADSANLVDGKMVLGKNTVDDGWVWFGVCGLRHGFSVPHGRER